MRLLDHLPDWIPFIAASAPAGATRNWSAQRIAEAIIIAIITAGGSTYVTTKVLDERVSELNRRMERVETMAERRYEKIQEDLQRISLLMAELRSDSRTRR